MIEVLRGPRAPARKAFRGWYSSYFDAKCDRAAVRNIVAAAAQTSDAVKIAELEGLLIDVAAMADGVRQPMLWLSASAHDQTFIGSHLKNVGFAQVYGSASSSNPPRRTRRSTLFLREYEAEECVALTHALRRLPLR